MDGISSTAAVIGLVQAATQVIAALGRYATRVKEAESSRAKLLEQIKLISAVGTTIVTIVQNSPPSTQTPQLQVQIDDWFKSDGPTTCKQDLEELLCWLEKETENNRHGKWTRKLGWPFKEDKIQAAIRTFERHMPFFRDVLSIKTFNLIEHMDTRLKNTEFNTARSELLSWVDGFDCTDKHESTLRERQQTTGDWLLKEDLYVGWREGSTKFIWLHGKAGAGKSVLASTVIDDISSRLAENETLAYFYCNFRHIRCTSAMEVLRSVTRQLLWNSKKDWFSSFSDLISRKERGAGPPTDLGVLSDLLRRAAELHERPIVVVDALDECVDLSNLLSGLGKLAHGRCRLFVTSRMIHSIHDAFTGLPAINLDNQADKMRIDMYLHIKTELESRSRLKNLAQTRKDLIQGVLMGKADGMFRWVQFQLDRLNECYSFDDVFEVLFTLPATLYETYDLMLRTIDKKPFGSRKARKALTWLATALRPLKLSELAEALSISCEEPVRDFARAPMDETAILDILGSLVTINSDNEITLSHYSVKEYLTSDETMNTTYHVSLPSASRELATVSIFSLMLLSDEPELTTKGEDNRLHSYTEFFGFRHLEDCHSDDNEILTKHLLAFQDHVFMYHHIYEQCRWFDGWMSVIPDLALHIIIRFGHPDLLRHYLDSHSVQATEEDNPLVFAALYSDIPHVQLLVDKGLDVNCPSLVYFYGLAYIMTPLTAAAQNRTLYNQEFLVSLLLENGCIVPKDAIYSILSCTIVNPSDCAVIRTLLERGADPRWLGAKGKTCLHLAAVRGKSNRHDREIFRMLVAAGGDPTTLDNDGHSPFQLAIRSFSTELVEWLLRQGLQLPSDAILSVASSFSSSCGAQKLFSTLEFLLRSGATAGAQDYRGYNALHYLSKKMEHLSDSAQGIVELLVEHGCDINCRNDAGETPLHLAVASPGFKLDALALFLVHGAELPVDIVNYAVQGFHHHPDNNEGAAAILTFLVEKLGASCQSHTINGDNALHCLLTHPTDPESKLISDAFSLLVENGCDFHAIASSGETPLQLAIENYQFSIAESVLAQIATPYFIDYTQPYSGDSQGNGILHRLCRGRWGGPWVDSLEEKMQLLQEAGYNCARDINRPNNKGFTPLSIAVFQAQDNVTGRHAVVSWLLDLGASFHHINYLHLENLEWASGLPWYCDAAKARERCLSRSKTTFDHIFLVYCLLRIAYQGSLSSALVLSILDMAEYWACMTITRKNVRRATPDGYEQIIFPVVPGNAGCWIPRRVVLRLKVGVLTPRDHRVFTTAHIGRKDVLFKVPIAVISFHVPADASEVPDWPSFDVWDESTPAVQGNGTRHLMVRELVPGDILIMEFDWLGNYPFTLDYFQIEIYYALESPARETSEVCE